MTSVKRIRTLSVRSINKFLALLSVQLVRKSALKVVHRTGVNLNVGCGSYEIAGFVSLDFYSKHYYGGTNFDRVVYDIRRDQLPYDDNTVDSIFCSHVIEHLETPHVVKFFRESLRVLKVDGVLRISCPDSLFLFKQLEFPKYFSWHPDYKDEKDALICFVDEVATHRKNLPNFGLEKNLFAYDYKDLMQKLRLGGQFNEETPGMHINNWDYSRVSELAQAVGFRYAVESKFNASSCPILRGPDMDMSKPQMSLYVDLIK